jgi:hypothetical protein
MSTITTTIELGDYELEVEIEYKAYPGERMVMYERDGSGYPGSPPYAELIGVTVLEMKVSGYELHDNPLAQDAYRYVETNWKRFEEMCLEDAALRDEAARDAAEEDKFERRRLGE